MIRIPKVMAIGVTAGLLTASAASAASPDLGANVGPQAFAALAGDNVRDIRVKTGRSVSEPAGYHRRGFYGDGFGYGFGGYDYD